jgi:DNA-binding NarL/FixJ family response regulator
MDTEQTERIGDFSRSRVQGESRTERVLVIEDHDLFRQTLTLVLGQHADFAERIQAGSVAEARKVLGRLDGRPQLVVVDLDLDGAVVYELLEELREAEVAVLALTTSQDTRTRDRALRSGADEVHTTTAPMEDIITAARRLVGR